MVEYAGMRNLVRVTLAAALVIGVVPVDALGCTVGGFPCPRGLKIEAISCKAEASTETPSPSTCAGWVPTPAEWDSPRVPVDVSGYVDIGVDSWSLIDTGALGVQVMRDGNWLSPIWSDARRVRLDEDDDFTVRNLPSHLLPVLFNRCVTDDPTTREFRVSLVALTRVDDKWVPESRVFTLRIAPDGYVEPAHCA